MRSLLRRKSTGTPLALHQRKPVVVTDQRGNESIAIHSVGVLAMAWDHRAFDGAYAAAFMHRVKEIIEEREWEAEVH